MTFIVTETNIVRDSVISSNIAPFNGSVDDLKTHFRSRCPIWRSSETDGQDLVISGQLTDEQLVRYWSLPQNNMAPEHTVQLTLRETDQNGAILYQSPVLTVADFIPWGNWRAGKYHTFHPSFGGIRNYEGVEPYNGSLRLAQGAPVPIRLIDPVAGVSHWEIRLNISRTINTHARFWCFRMAMIGEYMQLSRCHSLGNTSESLTAPELIINNVGLAESLMGRQPRRGIRLPFSALNESDRVLIGAHEQSHANDYFIVHPYPDETDWIFAEQTFVASYQGALGHTHTHTHLNEVAAEFYEL